MTDWLEGFHCAMVGPNCSVQVAFLPQQSARLPFPTVQCIGRMSLLCEKHRLPGQGERLVILALEFMDLSKVAESEGLDVFVINLFGEPPCERGGSRKNLSVDAT